MLADTIRQLEELWAQLDQLLAPLTPADWQKPHGAEWVFADLPYHLGYVDRLIVVEPIRFGRDLPVEKQAELASVARLNEWNRQQFALRPPNQTVQDSLRQMCESRDEIRRLAADMSDADLEQPAWHHILQWRGFRSVALSLDFCVRHTWGHVEEARIWLGRSAGEIAPSARHRAFGWRFGLIHGLFLDPARLRDPRFTLLTEVTGPGGGMWTTVVGDGRVAVSPSALAEPPDLTLSMSVDAAVKWLYFMAAPEQLMAAGDIEADDLRTLGQFSELMRMPDMSQPAPVMEWP